MIQLSQTPTIKFGENATSARSANTLLGGGDVIIEYTSTPFASDAAHRAANCGLVGDADPNWSDTPSAVGGLSAVTAVRYKYTKPLAPAEGVVIGLPLVRTTNAVSLALPEGTAIPWVAHFYSKNDVTGTSFFRRSTYTGGAGLAQLGGRITAHSIKIRGAAVATPSSVAPNSQTTITITPRV